MQNTSTLWVTRLGFIWTLFTTNYAWLPGTSWFSCVFCIHTFPALCYSFSQFISPPWSQTTFNFLICRALKDIMFSFSDVPSVLHRQVFTVVSVHITIFWVMMQCVIVYSNFLAELAACCEVSPKVEVASTVHSLTTQETSIWMCTYSYVVSTYDLFMSGILTLWTTWC